jgi:hypothetical protein
MSSDVLSFSAGQVATLTAQFVLSPSGQPVDVPDAMVSVWLGDSAILEPTPMVNVMLGFYFYDWAIPNSLPQNTYTVRYTGTVAGVPNAATSYLRVLPPGLPPGIAQTSRQVELIAALETYLGCAQAIPVYNELSRANGAKDEFQLTWPRWNLANHSIFLNDEEATTSATIDLDTGTVRFDPPLRVEDRVVATYNFRFFSSVDLLRFINDAISFINIEVPGTSYTIDTLPEVAVGTALMGAATQALHKLLLCLVFQEPQTIFGGREGAQQAEANLRGLKENYEKSFWEYKKQFKRMRWPNTISIVQPEYTLPGGRSRWFRYLFSSGVF